MVAAGELKGNSIMLMRTSFASTVAAVAIVAGLSGCTSFGTSSSSPAPIAAAATVQGPAATVGAASATGVKDGGLVPEVEATTAVQARDLSRSVYYEFDRYDVKPGYHALVAQHAAWLRANPAARLVIVGNTDERGTSEYNLALGQRRAESVTRMLLLMGAKEEQIEAVSFGKEKPAAQGSGEDVWAQNRRAEITYR